MVTNILLLIRIKDWLKNIVIFLPLIFSGNLSKIDLYQNLLFSFIIFSFISTFLYIINDIIDIKQDQKHTFKKIKKPLANKSISINFAIILLLLFIVASLIILYFYQTILYHVLLYFFLTLGYSLFLKTIPYLDILLICFGYLIRLDAGSAIISVETSLMLATSVFTLSLFVLSIKRLVELNYQTHKRKSLIYYSSKFLNVIIYLSSFIFLLFSFIFFIN